MAALEKNIHILVVEDNSGDFVLIQEYLVEEMEHPEVEHATTFAEAQQLLQDSDRFDVILLDLTLPDAIGESLVEDVVELSGAVPVVVLTGYENKEFGLKTLSMGVADYLLKDELNPFLLSKSISYSIERNRINRSLKISERKYRDIFNLSPQPMWVYDLETLEFLDVNQAAIDHYGYSREEFLEMTLEDIRSDEDIPELMEAVEESHGKQEFHFEGLFRHQTKEKKIIDVKIKSNIIEYQGRKAEMVLAEDMTEKLKSERELKLSEQKFRSLVQEGADMITVLDHQGIYKYVSPNYENITGWTPRELKGESVFDLIHSDDRKSVREDFAALQDDKQVQTLPFRFKHKDGHWLWIESAGRSLSRDAVYDGYVINSHDVTERREREMQLEHSLKEKETLLLEIHHRVKNNLAVVSGMMQLQAFEEEDERLKKRLFASVTRIQTMGSIHELLYQSENFSRLDFDENIKRLVKNVVTTLQSESTMDIAYNIEPMSLNINQAIPCSLIVNEVITNTIKHAFQDREAGQVKVSASEEGGTVFLSIKDNGRGLPEDFGDQSDQNTLGLKLIDTLAEQLKGKYEYHSIEEGTEFTLSFEKADVKGIGNIHL